MKLREHEQIVNRILRTHRMEIANLKNQIAVLKETVEGLRLRTQAAEYKVVETRDLWWSEETSTIPDYELADHEKEIERVST